VSMCGPREPRVIGRLKVVASTLMGLARRKVGQRDCMFSTVS
jgi:hypothetical protein